MGDKPAVVEKDDPEKMSEPVVRALTKMKDAMLVMLPKRIGQETKTVTLADFSAVTA